MKDYYSYGHVMSSAWKIATKNWLVLIGLYLGYFICTFIINAFSGGEPNLRFMTVNLCLLAFAALFTCGYYQMYLNAAKGEEPEFSVFKEKAHLTLKMFIVTLIISACTVIMMLIGLFVFGAIIATTVDTNTLLAIVESVKNNSFDISYISEISGSLVLSAFLSFLIVIFPFAWVYIKISFAPIALVDKECSIGEAFRTSFAISKNHMWTIFMLYFTGAMMIFVSLLALIVGVFFGMVVYLAIYTEQYRALKLLYDHKDNVSDNGNYEVEA